MTVSEERDEGRERETQKEVGKQLDGPKFIQFEYISLHILSLFVLFKKRVDLLLFGFLSLFVYE